MTETQPETMDIATDIQDDKLAHEKSFIDNLAKVLGNDTGRAAMLRRNAGNTSAEARGVEWFFGVLGMSSIKRRDDGTFYDEEVYFLIATLFASDKKTINGIVEGKNAYNKGDFGATLLALRSKSGAKISEPSPLDRRFNIILDADFDPNTGGELAYRLRQMTKRVINEKDQKIRINWPQLLYDVKRWNWSRKPTQKNWARSYYAPGQNNDESTISND